MAFTTRDNHVVYMDRCTQWEKYRSRLYLSIEDRYMRQQHAYVKLMTAVLPGQTDLYTTETEQTVRVIIFNYPNGQTRIKPMYSRKTKLLNYRGKSHCISRQRDDQKAHLQRILWKN